MSYADSVQRAIDYIEAHLEEELNIASLAEEAYISVAQLYRVFYALTGHPIKDYIRKRRISAAANHLRNSRRKVEELAWESGFESYHSFAKAFKKIVGLTPAAYRKADIYFSFEPIRLREQVAYMEDKGQAERFPDVKVIRFMPEQVYAYSHIAEREAGMENEAFRVVCEKLAANNPAITAKLRIFGRNEDLPEGDGYGYRMLIVCEDEGELAVSELFTREPFEGGLYAVRKVAAQAPQTVQEGWDRLLSEWLPLSTFEIGAHRYLEEFIAYSGKITRMNLYLPVQRMQRSEPIEVVELAMAKAFFCREYGHDAQRRAEQRLIEEYKAVSGCGGEWARKGNYYMSYHYGARGSEEDWWENGIIVTGPKAMELADEGQAGMESGIYACCLSKTYGLLTGVLDKMHRWIAANADYRLDEKRQWFAEYYTFPDMNIERDTVVKVYIPILVEGE